MVISFEKEKLKYQFKKFIKTGKVPEAVYAGEIACTDSSSAWWANILFVLEADTQYKKITQNLATFSIDFKLLYTLSRYRRGVNPVAALYEELQNSLLKDNKNKFDKWLFKFCDEHYDKIMNAIEHDIKSIKGYLDTYEKAGHDGLPSLLITLRKLERLRVGFHQHRCAIRKQTSS